ncbi:hypothetical protein G6F46_014308 [Rhizopus delemar]|nr:hypothetical protein G6F46_014308 [Rhizopus delemar]
MRAGMHRHRLGGVGFGLGDELQVGHALQHVVVAALVQRRHARRPAAGQRAAVGALHVPGVIRAVGHLHVAIGVLRRTGRIELHHAGRGVAAEQPGSPSAAGFPAPRRHTPARPAATR